ncbi:hypothetical protein AOLI_G00219700 [Acnodon oligacanthus]
MPLGTRRGRAAKTRHEKSHQRSPKTDQWTRLHREVREDGLHGGTSSAHETKFKQIRERARDAEPREEEEDEEEEEDNIVTVRQDKRYVYVPRALARVVRLINHLPALFRSGFGPAGF